MVVDLVVTVPRLVIDSATLFADHVEQYWLHLSRVVPSGPGELDESDPCSAPGRRRSVEGERRDLRSEGAVESDAGTLSDETEDQHPSLADRGPHGQDRRYFFKGWCSR